MEKPTLHTDSSIQRKNEDTLGCKEFAQNIAKAITNSPVKQDSFVMGLLQ